MAVERTLSIIKPDAVARNVIGKIYSRFEDQGLRIIAARMLHLSRAQAAQFSEIHRDRPFYQEPASYSHPDLYTKPAVAGAASHHIATRGRQAAPVAPRTI